VHEKVAPFSCVAAVWTVLFGEEACKVGFCLDDVSEIGVVEVGHVDCERLLHD